MEGDKGVNEIVQTEAGELNLSVNVVSTAKSRVLQRLRQLSEGLLEWGEACQADPTL
jgi:hypothetical protein